MQHTQCCVASLLTFMSQLHARLLVGCARVAKSAAENSVKYSNKRRLASQQKSQLARVLTAVLGEFTFSWWPSSSCLVCDVDIILRATTHCQWLASSGWPCDKVHHRRNKYPRNRIEQLAGTAQVSAWITEWSLCGQFVYRPIKFWNSSISSCSKFSTPFPGQFSHFRRLFRHICHLILSLPGNFVNLVAIFAIWHIWLCHFPTHSLYFGMLSTCCKGLSQIPKWRNSTLQRAAKTTKFEKSDEMPDPKWRRIWKNNDTDLGKVVLFLSVTLLGVLLAQDG